MFQVSILFSAFLPKRRLKNGIVAFRLIIETLKNISDIKDPRMSRISLNEKSFQGFFELLIKVKKKRHDEWISGIIFKKIVSNYKQLYQVFKFSPPSIH